MPTPLEDALSRYSALSLSLSSLSLSMAGGRARVYRVPVSRDGGGQQVCIENSDGKRIGPDSGPDDVFGGAPPIDPDELARKKPWEIPIPVTVFDGPEALRRACGSFGKTIRRFDQPPDKPDRLPGYLLFEAGGRMAEAAEAAVKSCNFNKEEFKKAVAALALSHEGRRSVMQGTELQHVLLLQAYRKIVLLKADVEAISFSWSGASTKVSTITKKQLLAKVSALNETPDASQWELRVSKCPDQEFARVVRMPPFVVANLRIDGKWSKRVPAPMPLVLIGRNLQHLEVTDLKSYEPGAELYERDWGGADNKGTLSKVPFIEELGIHRYLVRPPPADKRQAQRQGKKAKPG